MKKLHVKTEGREHALQYLYMVDVLGGREVESFDDFVAALDEQPRDEALKFARQIVTIVSEHGNEIDKQIEGAGSNWSLRRMSAVDRNILRIGVAELSVDEASFKIIINEAVELARKFSDPMESPKFVNGILDKVRKEQKQEEEKVV